MTQPSFAQQQMQPNTHFEQLTSAEQRIQVQAWMNSSQDVLLPAEIAEQAKKFYGPGTQGDMLFKKNTFVLAPLFNKRLAIADRLSYCNYLLNHFTEEEIPLDIVRNCKRTFMNPVNR